MTDKSEQKTLISTFSGGNNTDYLTVNNRYTYILFKCNNKISH